MAYLTVRIDDGQAIVFDTEKPVDLSIPLRFDDAQPNHFGAPYAVGSALKSGDFVGDTRDGGSCNCEQYTLIPHCNGTHTECVGHITDDRVSIRDVLQDSLLPARLVTLGTTRAQDSDETSTPEPQVGDMLLTRVALDAALSHTSNSTVSALIVRTQPNDIDKRKKRYGPGCEPPFFTAEAMHAIVDMGIRHLLVDTPTLDRMHDGGHLTAHRIFWGLPAGSRKLSDAQRAGATVTEMVYVADDVADGMYLLNLQIAPFDADAAPSRPLLYPQVN